MDADTIRMDPIKSFPSSSGDIFLGPLPALGARILHEHGSKIIALADENTMRHCIPLIEKYVDFTSIIVIPPGESHKDLRSCEVIWKELVNSGADKNSLLLNVGGGMITDIGGFAASCYQRGIPFAHVPTSLLGMTDAAIGGKTGVDFMSLKNYLGVIRFPAFVWIDDIFLRTLPQQELHSGLAEIVKHAIIGSHDLWEDLVRFHKSASTSFLELIEKSIPVKLHVVEADPEEKGIRKILNFGHTIGHALESFYLKNDESVLHGNCIATGMLVEARISESMQLLSGADFRIVTGFIADFLTLVQDPLPTFDELWPFIVKDKKNAEGQIRFSLPDKIGSCGWDIPVKKEIISDSYHWLTQAKA